MPARPDYFTVLLEKARQDYDAACDLLANAAIAEEVIGFHCQQAVEKSIKAVLESRQAEYPLTHDLVALLAVLTRTVDTCPLGLEDALALNQFAVRFRYDLWAVMQPASVFDRARDEPGGNGPSVGADRKPEDVAHGPA
jgi:HEPN domain-containing protein